VSGNARQRRRRARERRFAWAVAATLRRGLEPLAGFLRRRGHQVGTVGERWTALVKTLEDLGVPREMWRDVDIDVREQLARAGLRARVGDG
jgi:hypothetical protein